MPAGGPRHVGGATYRGRHGPPQRRRTARTQRDVPLLRVRLAGREVGRPLRRVPGLGHAWPRSARVTVRTTAATAVERPAVPIGEVDVAAARSPGPPGSPSSTGCSAAASCPAPSCCWPASPASASPRCCSRSPRAGRARAGAARSTSPARSRPPRCGCAPSASGRWPARSTSPPRPTSARCSATSTRSSPTCWSSTRCRPSRSAEVEGVAGGVTQVREVAAALIRVAKARGIADRCSSATSPRTARSPGRGCSSTSSTSCCSSRATGTRGCGWCARSKNRYGPTDEVGCFDLSDDGIVGLADPSGLFLSAAHQPRSPGTCVTVTLEGRRPLRRRGAGAGHAVGARPPRGAPPRASTPPGSR